MKVKLDLGTRTNSAIETELGAVDWAVKHFRSCLHGRRFKIYCDHKPLVWLQNRIDPSNRLFRWKLKIQEFDFEIIQKSGKF